MVDSRVATNFFLFGAYTEAITYIGGDGMESYLNLVIILNFLVEICLVLGTNRISGCSLGVKRATLAALVGTAFSIGCLLPGFQFLGNVFWHMVSLVLVSVIAFGWHWDALRRGAIFVFLEMALGGITKGLMNGGFWAMGLGAVAIYLLCVVGFQGKPGQQHYVPVQIIHRGKTVSLMALVDTGNTLRDPVSGDAVLIADADVAWRLLSLDTQQLMHPIETISTCAYPGLRLIPYQSVGQSSGLLLGLRVEQLWIDGKRTEMILAFAPQNIGQGKPFQALAGGLV